MKRTYTPLICLLSFIFLLGNSFTLTAQIKRTQVFTITSGTNDAEEAVPGGSGTVGSMDLTSSDLEIMLDGTKRQLIGIRFTGVTIPQGAVVNRAFLQFANKGDKAPVAGDAYVTIEDGVNGAGFTSTAFNISSRVQLNDSVLWVGSTSNTWGTSAAGAAGADQRTPDIKSLIQPIVNKTTWASGNSLVLLLKGLGVRNSYSFDGSGGDVDLAPKLIIEFSTGATPLASSTFPLGKKSEWKFLDNGTDQGSAWRATAFDDASWNIGVGKLGYSDNATSLLSFGPDAGNKYITYYFRKQFNVSNVSVLLDSLKLSLLRDDGAIIYINGTEVARSNMPAGTIDHLTFSSTIVDGADESTYFDFTISKNVLVNGTNTIAVEVHQRDGTSSDLSFDLAMVEYTPIVVPVACVTLPASHISNYISVMPSAQPDSLRIPFSHTFQMLLQSGEPYTNPANGVTKSTFDFTGYVPIAGSSTNGYLSINHEAGTWPASGVSMLTINFNPSTKTWNVTNNVPVDFGVVGGTGRNCSGTVTPWNTIITSEETLPTADANGDGYEDIGWNVEIDPATHSVIDHDNNGQPDKLWKLGRMSHENVVVTADSLTVYEGNDENPGYIFKMIANAPGKLGSGNLYVLKLTGTPDNSSSGSWILVPNGTPAECNNVRSFAASLLATNFNSIEDVEISPKDGKVYFTSKASSRVYRFSDNGTSIANFDIFVGNAASIYNINYGTGTIAEQWRDGNDNLTFDDEGNLYVIQDGGRNHIWMVKPCHTAASPQVELFAVTPAGSEPTGMTFSPDYKFMFLSIQHPSGANATVMLDAAGNPEVFNKESAIVIARKEFLGQFSALPISFISFEASKTNDNKAKLEWQYISSDNTAKFEIERMVVGGSFETIKVITKSVTANSQEKHSFTDAFAVTGRNYYRVKAIQADGSVVYTNIRIVTIDKSAQFQVINSYPNPAISIFEVLINNESAKTVYAEVFNSSSSKVLEKNQSLVSGSNKILFDVSSLASGIYFLRLRSGNEVVNTTFVKK